MRSLAYMLSIILLAACSNNDTVDDAETPLPEKADTSYNYFAKPDSSYEVVNTDGYYVWEVNAIKKTLRKNPGLRGNGDIDAIINGLNSQYEEIKLNKDGLRHDTLFLSIKDALYLTNQMGSSGPAQYLAQAVINLTSVPGVNYVHLNFKEGEHAGPGTWSRKDFPGYIIVQ